MRDHVSYIGETTFHQRFQGFGIKQADRLSHVHVLGKTTVWLTPPEQWTRLRVAS